MGQQCYFEYLYDDVDDWTKGGGAVHLDVWFGSDMLQFGGGIGYTGLFMIEDTIVNGASDLIEYKATFAYIPITAQIRFFPMGGLYFGALAGYYYPMIVQEAYNITQGRKEPDVTDSGDSVFGVGLMAGYEVAIVDFLVLGVQLRYQAVFDVDDTNHNTALMLTAGVKF